MTPLPPHYPLIAHGAFIALQGSNILAALRAIPFQFNPETLTRKIEPFVKPADAKGGNEGEDAQAAPFDPNESFDVVIEFDATDDLEEPELHPAAVVVGVGARLAALEMLMYPVEAGGLLSSAINALAGLLGGGSVATVPEKRQSPTVLLVWGPGRIVPVKVNSISIEEQAFNAALYPIRAKVTVSLAVLTVDYFTARAAQTSLTADEELALAAMKFTVKQKRVLADTAAMTNALDSVLGQFSL